MGCGASSKYTSTSEAIPNDDNEIVLQGAYTVHMSKEACLGEGTFAVCHLGRVLATGESVAIKVLKADKSIRDTAISLKRFRKELRIINALHQPLHHAPGEPSLWHEELRSKPERHFARLLAFSRSDTGPGQDTRCGLTYLVMELAQYSLLELLKKHRDTLPCGRLSNLSLKEIGHCVLSGVAAMHVRSVVHMDLKPDNIMLFGDTWKIIDVDGCSRVGQLVSFEDANVSFSPCYCAPEWAYFLVKESSRYRKFQVVPSLDAWSVGILLLETILLYSPMKPIYDVCASEACGDHEEAGLLFLDFLCEFDVSMFPETAEDTHSALWLSVERSLLALEPATRKTCAQCLSTLDFSSSTHTLTPVIEISEDASEAAFTSNGSPNRSKTTSPRSPGRDQQSATSVIVEEGNPTSPKRCHKSLTSVSVGEHKSTETVCTRLSPWSSASDLELRRESCMSSPKYSERLSRVRSHLSVESPRGRLSPTVKLIRYNTC